MTTRAFESVVAVDPEVMSGAPVFRGTRVPVHLLFDYLSSGETLDSVLEGFPSVTRELAVAALAGASPA
jgi:uncharacterized protein (DUF433 family)